MPNKFNYVKKGYDPSEVDEYIGHLEGVIKSYKDKDDAIKNAIINAQVAADNIILNARNRSVEISEGSYAQLKEIVDSVSKQKKMVKNFQDEYNAQIEKYLHTINKKDISEILNKIDCLEKYIGSFLKTENLESAGSNNNNPEVKKELKDEEVEALKGIFN